MSVGISSLTSDLERMSFGGTHSAAELELQVNIQADKARANFEAYYANRIAGFDKGANIHTRLALPPLSMTDHPYITIDCGPAGFDYSHIPQLIEDQIQERIKLGRSLEQQRPISVKFRGVDYSNIEKVCRAIAMSSNETTPLERLSLAGMKLEADDAKALVELLCKNTSITDLDVSDNAWDCDGVEVICSCFATGVDGKSASNTTVKRLDLGGCSLGKAVMKRIASFLPRWEYLEHLQLNGNNIGIYGMEELCCGLRSNKSLKTLSLCNTSIGLDGLKFLAQILESGGASLEDTTKGANACAGEPSEQCELNTSLVHVQLEGNRGVEDTHELFTSIMVSLHRNVQRRVREELIKAELELREQMLDTSTTILDNIHLIQQADRARIVEESTNSIKDQNSNNAPKADKTAVSKKIPTSATVPNKKMAPPGTVSGKSGTPSGNVTQKKVPTSIAPKSLKSAPKYTTPAQSTSTGKVSKQTVSSTKTTK